VRVQIASVEHQSEIFGSSDPVSVIHSAVAGIPLDPEKTHGN
jgi:hypothetical protein